MTHLSQLSHQKRDTHPKNVYNLCVNKIIYQNEPHCIGLDVASETSETHIDIYDKNIIFPFNLNKEKLDIILRFMVARTDFFWKYEKTPFHQKQNISGEFLRDHFLGAKIGGFSPFIDNEKIMFGAIDFDAHTSEDLSNEENERLIKEAQEDSKRVYEFIKKQYPFVIRNSSGSKGRHVRMYCEGALAKDIRIYFKWVLEQVCGDIDKHEIFPKQDNLNEERPYGNQIKGFLGIHPKTKQRSTIIVNDIQLDMFDSIKFITELMKLEKVGRIEMPSEDYDRIATMDKATAYIEKVKSLGKNFVIDNTSVPNYCAFIEKIACKKALISSGRYNRHACLDPNIASYSIKHPEAKRMYMNKQGRTSDTALRNWSNYWKKDKPTFNCAQIIAYLKYHSKNNKDALKGLELCLECKNFKSFLEQKKKPKGYSKSFIISEIAQGENMLTCKKCSNKFIFNDDRGFYYCKKCKQGGGLKKFLQLIVNKQKEIQSK